MPVSVLVLVVVLVVSAAGTVWVVRRAPGRRVSSWEVLPSAVQAAADAAALEAADRSSGPGAGGVR